MVGVLVLLTSSGPSCADRCGAGSSRSGPLIVVFIGIGRVVLNVHHPSDVLAGWALGYAYFAVCLLLVPPRRPVTEVGETPEAPGIAR